MFLKPVCSQMSVTCVVKSEISTGTEKGVMPHLHGLPADLLNEKNVIFKYL